MERGLVGAFRLFIALRLLLWFTPYMGDGNGAANPAVSVFGIQTLGSPFYEAGVML